MIIAIASGKGGTGKTTLAVNLASYLSQKFKVVLVDLDVEEPNSGLFLVNNAKLVYQEDKYKMIPKWVPDNCTFCRECQINCNFNAIVQTKDQILVFPQLCHSCYACSDLCPEKTLPMIPMKIGQLKHYKINGLDFIESRLRIGEEMATPLIEQSVKFVLERFGDNYIKIFDSPPGTSCPVIEAVRKADYVLLVTEPTPFGLHDLKLAVETVRQLNKPFGVVVNRYGIGSTDVFHYCRDQNIQILAKIPNNRLIAQLYAAGQLIFDKIPDFKSALKQISEHILKIKNETQSV